MTEVVDLKGGRDGASRIYNLSESHELSLTQLSLRKLNDIQVLTRPVGMRW